MIQHVGSALAVGQLRAEADSRCLTALNDAVDGERTKLFL